MELRIDRLSKTYPNGVHALNDVSLTIAPGMFGLLGPNGAGKSTLMRILATLQEADSGTAALGEINVLRDKAAVRRTLGYLPQEFGLYPRSTAEEMLDHFAVLKGVVNARERRDTVRSLLEQTNLWDARGRRLGGFSGGMRQRFGIAVALIGNPRLIIVDEPTAGLDPAERARFLNLLSELGENAVVILSTHIVEDVSDLCQRMAIIKGGRILLEARPTEAVDALRGRVWRREVPRDQLPAFEEQHPVISTTLVGGRTVVHVVGDTHPGEGFEPVQPDLKDVYFTIMRGLSLVRAPEGPRIPADADGSVDPFSGGATVHPFGSADPARSVDAGHSVDARDSVDGQRSADSAPPIHPAASVDAFHHVNPMDAPPSAHPVAAHRPTDTSGGVHPASADRAVDGAPHRAAERVDGYAGPSPHAEVHRPSPGMAPPERSPAPIDPVTRSAVADDGNGHDPHPPEAPRHPGRGDGL